MTQPILGRQVSALQEELDIALFERVGKGFVLTPNGLDLLEHVRAMGQAAGNLFLTASGQSDTIAGNIRISTTDLVTSNTESDLKRREADIFIRGFQPTQPDLNATKIADVTAHIYASTSYLAEFGHPESPEDLKTTCFICDKPATVVGLHRRFGIELSHSSFTVVTESIVTQWELVKNGTGLAVLPDPLAVREPSFHKVLPDLLLYEGGLWLVVYRELRTNQRVRFVMYSFLIHVDIEML